MFCTPFAFALCQPGAETALKRDVARTQPALRSAYQRAGLVTWKAPLPRTLDDRIESAFARMSGVSLGNASDAREAIEVMAPLEQRVVLHVVERLRSREADELIPPYPPSARAAAFETALREHAPSLFAPEVQALPGQVVVTVAVAEAGPAFVGAGRQGEGAPYPGGVYPVRVPDEAPSRAYAKLVEALAVYGLEVRPGETALELGAAPGGAAHALIERGLRVIAVDPGAMDVRLMERAGSALVHLPIKASALTAALVPRRVEHLLVDVHLAPPVALRGLRKALSLVRDSVRDVIWTVKLNDWRLADDVPTYVEALRALGVHDARAVQLYANRQEVCIAGRMGTRRGA